MKSIKPGRGPSMMNSIGSVVAVVVGIIWTIGAASIGAPFFFVLFVVLGIVQTLYHLKNATGENRYSVFDITKDGEEPDPLQQWVQQTSQASQEPERQTQPQQGGFCPYCGTPVAGEYEFCPKCGKPLPDRQE